MSVQPQVHWDKSRAKVSDIYPGLCDFFVNGLYLEETEETERWNMKSMTKFLDMADKEQLCTRVG